MQFEAEQELVARLRAGDGAAFEQLIRASGGRLLAVAKRFFRNEADAQDALQDGLLSAFRGIQRFEGQSSLNTWLHTIVVRACLMKLRSRKNQQESISELLPEFESDGHRSRPGKAWTNEALQMIQRDETKTTVRKAIDQLPESYRTVLLMRDIEGLDTKAVAEAMDVSENVIKVRLHRARQALRELLDPWMREG